MATVTVKNIPDELYEKLKADAEIHRCSINSQIIVCIENAVGTRSIDVTEAHDHARRLRRNDGKGQIRPSYEKINSEQWNFAVRL